MRDPWDEYRVRRNVAVAAYGGFLPVVSGLGSALSGLVGNGGPIGVLLLGWVVFLGYARGRLRSWPCPRCGFPFLCGRVGLLWAQATHCLECGLPKWEDPGEYAEEEPS